jgi:hypothetical protein
MYRYEFYNRREIRMGSPFNICDLRLQGDYIPDLSGFEFQDIAISSTNRQIVYLIVWSVTDNKPGFKVLKLDEAEQSMVSSSEIKGFCCQLSLKNKDKDLVARVFSPENNDEIEVEIKFQ